MKKKLLFYCAIALSVAFFYSCTDTENNKHKKRQHLSGVDQEEVLEDPNVTLPRLVEEWNAALNNRDRKKKENMFAPMVVFYGKQLNMPDVVRLKMEAMRNDPSWLQEIVTDVDVVENVDGTYTTNFSKRSTSSKGVRTHEAYLVWKKFGDDWKIIMESDPVTDKNLSLKKPTPAY